MKIKKEDMIRFLQANSTYALKGALADATARVAIYVGGQEQKIMKKSARKLHETLPGSSLQILPGYSHGELSLNHPAEYVDALTRLLEGG